MKTDANLREVVRRTESVLETISQGTQGWAAVRLPPAAWNELERLLQALSDPLHKARDAVSAGADDRAAAENLSLALSALVGSEVFGKTRPPVAVRTRGAAIRTRGAGVPQRTPSADGGITEAPESLVKLLNSILYA